MCANAERWQADAGGVSLYLDGTVYVECIAEHYLLGVRVYAEFAIFGRYQVELFEVFSSVNAQSLEHIGVIF